jgi:hypothetical protein
MVKVLPRKSTLKPKVKVLPRKSTLRQELKIPAP